MFSVKLTFLICFILLDQNINYFYSFAIFTHGLLSNEFLNGQQKAMWALFLYLNFDWIALLAEDTLWTFGEMVYDQIHGQFFVNVLWMLQENGEFCATECNAL